MVRQRARDARDAFAGVGTVHIPPPDETESPQDAPGAADTTGGASTGSQEPAQPRAAGKSPKPARRRAPANATNGTKDSGKVAAVTPPAADPAPLAPEPEQPRQSANAARRELDSASRAVRAIADKLSERERDWYAAVRGARIAGVPEYELAVAAARAGMDLPDQAAAP
jgi:hypothetical protein